MPPQIGDLGVTAVSVVMAAEHLRVPSFHHNVQDWLSHVEAYLASISANDQQKFSAVVGALLTEVATLVQSRHEAVCPVAADATYQRTLQHFTTKSFSSIHVSSKTAMRCKSNTIHI